MKPDTRPAVLQDAVLLVWVGLLSIGASGLLALALQASLGAEFVAGAEPAFARVSG